MDEKQKVISTMRALLSFRNEPTPLRELKYEYCRRESTNEIPCFEYKSLVDFLISSGEFVVNVDPTGLVTVREKPKSMSSQLKKATDHKMRGSSVVNAVKNFICKHKGEESPAKKEIEMTQWDASEKKPSRVAAKINFEVDPNLRLPAHASKPSTVFTFSQLNQQLNPFIETQNEPDQEAFMETVKINHQTIARTTNNNIADRLSQVRNIFGV